MTKHYCSDKAAMSRRVYKPGYDENGNLDGRPRVAEIGAEDPLEKALRERGHALATDSEEDGNNENKNEEGTPCQVDRSQ